VDIHVGMVAYHICLYSTKKSHTVTAEFCQGHSQLFVRSQAETRIIALSVGHIGATTLRTFISYGYCQYNRSGSGFTIPYVPDLQHRGRF